jgi:hypothetical protein
MKKLLYIFAALAATILASTTASAGTYVFTGIFSGGAEVVPNASPGTGNVTVTIDDVTNTVGVGIVYSGDMFAAIGAGLYCCNGPGLASPPVQSFTTFPVSKSANWQATYPGLPAPLISQLKLGGDYVNIRTDGFSNGEIRADLTLQQTPEPATFAMIGLGLTALSLIKRRKR